MGTISHKHVDDTLTDAIKMAALRARKSVREYTLDALRDAVARDTDTSAPVDPTVRKSVARAAAPVVPASEIVPPAHDPETCRLRGCGMCAAIKDARE